TCALPISTYDPASRSAAILGERLDLRGANVVFVDRVDSADGPVIVGTTTVRPQPTDPRLGESHALLVLLRDTPELLQFLRCEAELAEPLNQIAMAPICTEA